MAVRVGINGFGRIGRLTLRAILKHHPEGIDVVAINDLTDVKTNAHLFQVGLDLWAVRRAKSVRRKTNLSSTGKKIAVFAERDPAVIPWDRVGADIVIESLASSPTRPKPSPIANTASRRS